MISQKSFYELLSKNGVSFFSGVPDSLLKNFCAYITDHTDQRHHIIAANEGNAIGLAAGHYLATGRPALVYMQNSGQGNAVNPLMSLADPEVYGIPILLLIGWRGEPGVHDEPQHVKQGKITLALLDTLGIPHAVLPETDEEAARSVEKAYQSMRERSAPYALVARKGVFEEYKLQRVISTAYALKREDALKIIVDCLEKNDVVVSTTGMTSRELFEYRESLRQNHSRDFLTVGSMGHSSQIALGIALAKPERTVFCFDGDGAVIMHMGALGIIGAHGPSNFKHIVFNNGAHDSVGGQPTAGFYIDIGKIAQACGYKMVLRAETPDEIKEQMRVIKDSNGPALLEIRVSKGARKDLGRPTTTPIENKNAFMKFLKE